MDRGYAILRLVACEVVLPGFLQVTLWALDLPKPDPAPPIVTARPHDNTAEVTVQPRGPNGRPMSCQ